MDRVVHVLLLGSKNGLFKINRFVISQLKLPPRLKVTPSPAIFVTNRVRELKTIACQGRTFRVTAYQKAWNRL